VSSGVPDTGRRCRALRLAILLLAVASAVAFADDEPNCDPDAGLVDGSCLPGEPIPGPCDLPGARGFIACHGEEFDRVDAELNRVYRHLMAALPQEGAGLTRAKLRTEQRRWIRWKESHCRERGDAEGGSFGWKAAFALGCEIEVTAQRLAQLEALMSKTANK
jgi:uncharacterized protein YecT (DUF1311 family)